MKTLMTMVSLILFAASALAQPADTKWNSSAKLLKGSCGQGVIVAVVERPGSMNLKFSLQGKPTGDVNVTLAPDGSGQTEFDGAGGRVKLDVSAGTGKRPLKTSQVGGQCEWSWN
jgi:hypothetical protein